MVNTTTRRSLKFLIAAFAVFLLLTIAKVLPVHAESGVFNGTRVTDGAYVIKNSDTKEIDPAALRYLTANQLRIARNEIYARHGRKFGNGDLQAYFNSCSWYKGTISADDFDDDVLSDVENINAGTISIAESRVNPYSEYIIPDSASVYLTETNLQYMTLEQLRFARNEIYARHGRKFKDETLKKHFNSCSWYSGTIDGSSFDDDVLNDCEYKNAALISKVEEKKKNGGSSSSESSKPSTPPASSSKEIRDGYYYATLMYTKDDPNKSGVLNTWSFGSDDTFTVEGSWQYMKDDSGEAWNNPEYLEYDSRDFKLASDVEYFYIGEEKRPKTDGYFWTVMAADDHHGNKGLGFQILVKDGKIVEMAVTQ
ncbi:MAG: YARHG domain-containing protein [Lachnospiraceae bacterium]|nr:YARHG domain-containing protein [Lachnospiraceae bacterium]